MTDFIEKKKLKKEKKIKKKTKPKKKPIKRKTTKKGNVMLSQPVQPIGPSQVYGSGLTIISQAPPTTAPPDYPNLAANYLVNKKPQPITEQSIVVIPKTKKVAIEKVVKVETPKKTTTPIKKKFTNITKPRVDEYTVKGLNKIRTLHDLKAHMIAANLDIDNSILNQITAKNRPQATNLFMEKYNERFNKKADKHFNKKVEELSTPNKLEFQDVAPPSVGIAENQTAYTGDDLDKAMSQYLSKHRQSHELTTPIKVLVEKLKPPPKIKPPPKAKPPKKDKLQTKTDHPILAPDTYDLDDFQDQTATTLKYLILGPKWTLKSSLTGFFK